MAVFRSAQPATHCHMSSDGVQLFLLRIADASMHSLAVDVFSAPRRASEPLVPARSVLLPSGWTQFPMGMRAARAERRRRPFEFTVGQKVDAKDSVNKWCSGTVVQVTPSRVLVSYVGWSSKWDECELPRRW
jgi:hypothetical protein